MAPDEPARVLASGLDTLYLSLQVRWIDQTFLERLDDLKKQARAEHRSIPVVMPADDQAKATFDLSENGVSGYAYLLRSRSLVLKVGGWIEPGSRPSVVIEIGSEALWHHTPQEIVDRARNLIESNGGEILETKVSRADLCIDILLPEDQWHDRLADHKVTRSRKYAAYHEGPTFSGLSIGSGDLQARFYDKPLEIKSKGDKGWFFDIWELEQVTKGFRVIRIEFQLRRETLKQLGVGDYPTFIEGLREVWGYLTQKWLRMVRDKVHHNIEAFLPWWETVQTGFMGQSKPQPILRTKTHRISEKQMAEQAWGVVTSAIALNRQGDQTQRQRQIDPSTAILELKRLLDRHPMPIDNFRDRVDEKIARYETFETGFAESPSHRPPAALSLPKTQTQSRESA
ncbi:hypothetical protein [Mucisphaera sp.]|uniref:hypothetical protein n=1 Tax=Mucisphaera sp. TaxID=2913024 RepID=UPI003D0AA034